MQRNKEIEKDCCKEPDNFVFRSYADQSAELKCKRCGHVVRVFEAPNFDKPQNK